MLEADINEEGTSRSVANTEVSCEKPSRTGRLDPAAVCRSSDAVAVRELLTKIGDKWTIFLVLSLDLLGGRARFSELERAVPGISQRMLSST
jgi:DNA-binding HxlR family transcriptional regulator